MSQATGRFLVRSQAEEDCLSFVFFHYYRLGTCCQAELFIFPCSIFLFFFVLVVPEPLLEASTCVVWSRGLMSLGTDKRYNSPESRVLFYSPVFCFVIVDFSVTAFLTSIVNHSFGLLVHLQRASLRRMRKLGVSRVRVRRSICCCPCRNESDMSSGDPSDFHVHSSGNV
jgi:hypothetical protein